MNNLTELGRRSRQGRKYDKEMFAPRRGKKMDIRRREKRVQFDVPDDSDVESGGKGFFERMRSNPLYLPVVFTSLGALLGACVLNWYYVKYPPTQIDANDRRERTVVSAIVGGVLGLFTYFYLYKNHKKEEEEYGEDDDDDDDFSF